MTLINHPFDDFFVGVQQDLIYRAFKRQYLVNANRTLRSQFEDLNNLITFTNSYYESNKDIWEALLQVLEHYRPTELTRTTITSYQDANNEMLDKGHGLALIDTDGEGLRSSTANKSKGKSNSHSINELLNSGDIANVPLIREYFNIICEPWIW